MKDTMSTINFDTYQQQAMRTAKPGDADFDLMHAAYGLAGEVGEFVDTIKKHFIYDKPLDLENLKEEIGDVLWFCALAANAMNVNLSTLAQQNIDKLRARYPEKYSDALAAARLDKQHEQKVPQA